MKIIGISSGLSYNGYTANLVRVALQLVANQGALVEEIFLPDYEVKLCKGCFSCLAKGKCVINDDLECLRQKLACADGIIIGTQAFGSEPDPGMQNFINRIGCSNQYTGSLSDKYLFAIATTEAFGANHAAQKLTRLTFDFFKGGFISGVLGVDVSWEQIERYPEYLGRIEHFGIKMFNDIRQKRRLQLNGIFERLSNRLFRVPQIRKAVLAQKDGKMEAVYQKLSARGWLGDSSLETSRANINATATVRS